MAKRTGIELKKDTIDKLNQQAWDMRVHDSPQSFKLTQRSLGLARKIRYKKGIAEATRSMGFCYVRLSKFDEAVPLLNESLSLSKELNDMRGQSVVSEYLAVIKRNQGDLRSAMKILFKTLSISQQNGFKEDEAIQHYQLGITYKYLGNFDKALESLFKSISIHKENKNRFYQSYPINIIGSIYFGTGDHKQALGYFKEALSLRQEFGDKLGEAGSLDNIGYTLFKLKKYKEALKYCKQGLAISRKTDDKRGQANSLQHIAEIQAGTGDTKQAIISCNASRKIRKVTGDKRGEAEILIFLAGLPEQDPQKILTWISGALQIAKETRSIDLQSKAHYCLYGHYKQAKQFKEANKELEKHYALEKQLQKNSVNQKITNLEITRKAEEVRKEADVTRLKNEELTKLNHELEIERSLERVRAIALGMNKPGDILNICEAMFNELKLLGFDNLRNALINFWDDKNGLLLDYDYSDFAGGNFARLAYGSDPVFETFQKKIRRSKDAFAELIIKDKELAGWKQRRIDSGEYEDPRLDNISALHYYFYSTGVGALGISTFGPITTEKLELLKRFRNVFSLSYQRYKDISLAEAQAKEAKIETALERVRAVAMAMRKPEDLMQISEVIYNQLLALGFKQIRNVQIAIDHDEKPMYNGVEYSEYYQNRMKDVEYDTAPLFREIVNEIKRSSTAFYQKQITGKEFEEWRNWRMNIDDENDKAVHPALATATSMCFYLHSVGTGMLGISTFDPIDDEQLDILKRFKKVFELSYRRYIDIEKAEAQAKEAKIETALERVRARTMAMQKSDELREVAVLLYNQFLSLGVTSVLNCGYVEVDEINNMQQGWMTRTDGSPSESFNLPLTGDPIFQDRYDSWKRKDIVFHQIVTAAEMEKHIEFSRPKLPSKDVRELIVTKFPDPTIFYCGNFSNGYLHVITGILLSKDEETLLERFTRVFEQTYTRFLDLQRAEAQAREGQIEVALERVRSRAMAMQSSEELNTLIGTVFVELTKLDLALTRCIIWIFDPTTNAARWWMANVEEPSNPMSFYIKYHEAVPYLSFVNEWKKQTLKWVYDLKGKDKKEWDNILFKETDLAQLPDVVKDGMMAPERVLLSASFNNFGTLNVASLEPLSEEHFNILLRFAKVFDLTYTRFNDLKQAEAQAREAKIEAALEKIRSRSLAVHKSEEFKEVVGVIFEKLQELGIEADAASINVFIEGSKDMEVYISGLNSSGFLVSNFRLYYFDDIISNDRYRAQKSGIDFFSKTYTLQEKNTFFKSQFAASDMKNLPGNISERIFKAEQYTLSMAFTKHSMIVVNSFEGKTLSEYEIGLLKRFAKVFEQAYVRFLDLQKAEAQAREAQIEASLERVRSKTMAMHNSQDVGETVGMMFDELTRLGIETIRCGIGIMHPNKAMEVMTARADEKGKTSLVIGWIDMNLHPLLQGAYRSWSSKQESYSYVLKDQDLLHYFKAINNHADYPVRYDIDSLPKLIYHNEFYFPEGTLFAFSKEQPAEEVRKIFKRFAGVFGQTYRRYLDLLKAEAQAREATIEASLERVRSKAMAMHNSENLAETIAVFYHEMGSLHITPRRCGLGLMNKENRIAELSTMNTTDEGKTIEVIGRLKLQDHPILNGIYENWLKNKEYHPVLKGNEIKEYYQLIRPQVAFPDYPNDAVQYGYFFFFKEGGVYAWTEKEMNEDELQIYRRFTSVLSLTYKRYKDLKHSEAQTREAQIEVALERVRSKAMAMQKSEHLADAVAVVFEELDKLKLDIIRCGIGILNKNKKAVDVWTTTKADNDTVMQVYGNEPMDIHPLLEGAYHAWVQQATDYEYVLKGNDLHDYYKALQGSDFKLPSSQSLVVGAEDIVQYYYNAIFSAGGLFAFSEIPFTEEARNVLRRFADVFTLTYTRFLDLQKAEAQAREANIETGLERVRSRTLAMQRSEELSETAAELFRQLINLGIEPNRLYIGLVDPATKDMEMWATDEDGTSVEKKFTFNATDNRSVEKLFQGWVDKKRSVSVNMQGDELDAYMDYLKQLQVPISHGLTQKRRVQSVAYFDKGFIGMASPEEQSPQSIKLLERFAAVFNLTFTRFNDLKIAEAHAEQAGQDLIKLQTEKKRAEDALTELQSTQNQLIQSEKMASLGELTAGIAHEIQNPLNFVNNFSEVSKELLDEMRTEIESGNLEEAKDIMKDVIENLQKINHHGKRADGIVKGMLQHSRSSSGQKEMTDINALADEYLRLSYHGLRAKDKSFNATFKTDLDESIGEISVLPQDLGRVILNLLTNAFYVVNEKKKLNMDGYAPTVAVSTKKLGDKIEIRVTDNGNGIPKKVLDKIFQPFFTTKPTGQGTGLGLSLSYDIITKGHGGELKVETKEGEGSRFIIELPIG